MNYEEFKDKVQKELKNYLGDEYKDTQVVVREAMKVNRVIEQVMLSGIPGYQNASPSISLQDLYESYGKTGDFKGEMEKLSKQLRTQLKQLTVHHLSQV